MKKIALAAALLGILLAVPASSRIRGALATPDAPFSLDGSLIPAGALSDDDSSLVEEGMRSLKFSETPDRDRPGSRSDRRFPLTKEPAGRHGSDPSLPAGLRPDHLLRPAPARRGTDIALGRLRDSAAATADRLTREGWSCLPAGSGRGKILVGRITHGKETRVVVLEEAGSRFLFLRRMGE